MYVRRYTYIYIYTFIQYASLIIRVSFEFGFNARATASTCDAQEEARTCFSNAVELDACSRPREGRDRVKVAAPLYILFGFLQFPFPPTTSQKPLFFVAHALHVATPRAASMCMTASPSLLSSSTREHVSTDGFAYSLELCACR